MTREEVVKWLESLKKEIGKTENRTLWHYAESIDMAIEALSADRPTGDKEHLIDLIQEAVYDGEACAKLIDLVDRPTGECRTCARNADNGGYYEPEHRTRCPIQEHYALLLDGNCHLYEPYDCGAKMRGGTE